MNMHQLRVPDYLEHILEAIQRIRDYTDDMVEQTFINDRLVQDAVVHNFEIIGEASKNIEKHHPEFLKLHPELPLKAAYEMRNALAHGYFKIDLEIVWNTIQKDLLSFEMTIREVYKKNFEERK
jgi:uncharacterized protein with HEPN domain